MMIESASFSHAGPKGQNEDAILPPSQIANDSWAAIADGLGGHAGGEVASNSVIKTIASVLRGNSNTEIQFLFTSAQQRLNKLAVNKPHLAKMGTTLSVVKLSHSKAEVGHVGDTRIYHLRGDGIVDRTKDQTEVQRLIEEGVLSKARALKYPRRNILLSVLGPDRDYEFYHTSFDIEYGDRIVLLTDGIYETVFRREIRDLSLKYLSSEEFCKSLASEVASRGPKDDYTSICITIKSGS